MVLRHLLIVSQLQLLDCPLPSQPPAAVPRSDARRQSALSLVGTGSGSLLDRRSEEGRSGGRGDGSRFGGILRRHSSAGITAVEANQSGSRDGFDAGTSASGSGRYEVAEPEREAPPAATGLSGETAGRSGGSGGSGDSDVLGDVERSKRGTMQGGDGAVEGGGHAIEHAGKAGQDRGGAAGPAGETERDWIGTSSDAFEIAVAVLKVIILSSVFSSLGGDLLSYVSEWRPMFGYFISEKCAPTTVCKRNEAYMSQSVSTTSTRVTSK